MAARRAGGNLRIVDDAGTDIIISTLRLEGATVTELDDSEALIAVGSTGAFVPDATISATKSVGNPTFNFEALPENVIKVGSTYYCPYIDSGSDEVLYATATSRDGPWTAAGSTGFTFSSQTWSPIGANIIYAPHIILDGSTYYLFYSVCNSSNGTIGHIGYATSSAVTGPYVDHGSAILSPGSGTDWDSLRVGEPSVLVHAGTWYMAYMGETTAAAFGASEKLGMATATNPAGPWTKATGNPISWGASGAWDDALMADPDFFYLNGYFWIWYAGAPSTGPAVPAREGLLYTTTPTTISSWSRHLSNPILDVGGTGTWDDAQVFRGGIWIEDGAIGGVYTGSSSGTSLADCKGGNFRLVVSGAGAIQPTPGAADIAIADAGGYYTGSEVEAALQEIGADIAVLSAGGLGHWEVIVDGTAPPVAVTNEAEDDWLYGFVPD